MLRKSLLAMLIVLVFFGLSYSQTPQQTINLKEGFNFIAFTVKPSITASQFKEQNPSIVDIYTYSAASGSFLSVSEGTLSTLSDGKGYIIRVNSALSINVSGDVLSAKSINLKAGFNLIGISKQVTATSFSKLMQEKSFVLGLYKWSPSSGSFISVITNAGVAVQIDGVDPSFASGQSYFIRLASDAVLNYDNGLISISIIDNGVNLLDPPAITPVITPSSGTYSSVQTITMSHDEPGTTIIYTIDGSDPSETNGYIYNSPLIISRSTTVKAIAKVLRDAPYLTPIKYSTVTSAIYNIILPDINITNLSASKDASGNCTILWNTNIPTSLRSNIVFWTSSVANTLDKKIAEMPLTPTTSHSMIISASDLPQSFVWIRISYIVSDTQGTYKDILFSEIKQPSGDLQISSISASKDASGNCIITWNTNIPTAIKSFITIWTQTTPLTNDKRYTEPISSASTTHSFQIPAVDIPATFTWIRIAYAISDTQGCYKDIQFNEIKPYQPTTTTNPQSLTISLGSGVNLEMVNLPAGTFTTGSKTATVTNNFYIGKTEVTVGQWKSVMNSGDPSSFKKGDNYPVEQVSWDDCQTFINTLNTKYSSYGTFRLPTEAEWEYACRAGTNTSNYWENLTDKDISKYCWYNGNSASSTHPVGSLLPNQWGLYDMMGNVYEWCWDSVTTADKALRGRCWGSNSDYISSSATTSVPASNRSNDVGFRIVLDSNQAQPQVKVASPVIYPNGGAYTSTQYVMMYSATPGAIIKFTTDGTIPSSTNGQAIYSSGTISISLTTTIKAIAIKSGMKDSDIVSASFVINSSEKSILSFSFLSLGVTGTINESLRTISVKVPAGSNITALVPSITVSSKAKINPLSGVTQNFTNPILYTVTAEDGSMKTYTVTVVKDQAVEKAITAFSFSSLGVIGTINESNKTISITVPFGTNLTSLVPTITVSNMATITPLSGLAQNFTNPVLYTVKAEDGSTQNYTVTVIQGTDNGTGTISGSVSPSGSIVQLYSNGVQVGNNITANTTFNFTNLKAGTYIVRAYNRTSATKGYYPKETTIIISSSSPNSTTNFVLETTPTIVITDKFATFYSDNSKINGQPLRIGDVVTASDSKNGVICGIYIVDTPGKYGNLGFLKVFGNEGTTPPNGALSGDTITLSINKTVAAVLSGSDQPIWIDGASPKVDISVGN